MFPRGEKERQRKQLSPLPATKPARRWPARFMSARRKSGGAARAVVGPHSDEIVFTLDGENASIYGSQGQQRSIVLSYKLAEAAVIEEIIDQKPVLLLDDVMSELDGDDAMRW